MIKSIFSRNRPDCCYFTAAAVPHFCARPVRLRLCRVRQVCAIKYELRATGQAALPMSLQVSSPGIVEGAQPHGFSPQAMMMQSIMAPMFSAMFSPPPSGPSPAERAAAEQQRAEAEKQRQAAEKAKNEAIKKWAKAQSDEEIRKQVEQQERLKQGEKVLSQMQTVGGRGWEA